jgi:hypothetical protein
MLARLDSYLIRADHIHIRLEREVEEGKITKKHATCQQIHQEAQWRHWKWIKTYTKPNQSAGSISHVLSPTLDPTTKKK